MKISPSAVDIQIGRAICCIRNFRGYAQEFVATKSNINQSTYSRIERGMVTISMEHFLDICKVMQVSPFLVLAAANCKVLSSPYEEDNYSIEKLNEFISSSTIHDSDKVLAFLRSNFTLPDMERLIFLLKVAQTGGGVNNNLFTLTLSTSPMSSL